MSTTSLIFFMFCAFIQIVYSNNNSLVDNSRDANSYFVVTRYKVQNLFYSCR